ncbi:MAG: Carbamoylphosphate synthase large subunit protein [Myxococcaceae bacterium]|nr:Carbamoylphosphate synthase large subunit protein [Myxococcaceae bacterium]
MPRHVVFVAPTPTEAAMRFARALAALDDVRVLGVVRTPPPDAARYYHDLARVDDPTDVRDILAAVELLQRRYGRPDRIVGVQEELMVPLAAAREHFDVPGTRPHTALLFRDKARMKDALRAAGLPVARHRLVTSPRDADEFAAEVGFPLILKPPAGVGARDTFRVTSRDALRRAVARVSPARPVLAEEMLVGREHSLETITVGGEPRVWSCSNYLPGCLEVLETPWIQWACVLPRALDAPVYRRARDLGFAAVRALGLEDGMTHMEWFERADGSLAIGEIAARPPGPQLCQMTGLVHGIDPYRAWARAAVDGELDAPWERRYAAGCAFVRGVGRGRVTAVTGVRATAAALGGALVEAKLPTIGAMKHEGYEGDGYVVVRHASTAGVRALITAVVETLKVHYEA